MFTKYYAEQNSNSLDSISEFYCKLLDKEPNKLKITPKLREILLENISQKEISKIIIESFSVGLDFDTFSSNLYISHECLRSLLLIMRKTETRSKLLKIYNVYKIFISSNLENDRDEYKEAYTELKERVKKAMKTGRVYMVRNKKTQEYYIGKCWTTIKNRLTRHLQSSKKENSKLYQNIKQHKKENFEIELLDERLYIREETKLGQIEDALIKEYRDKNPELCLNTKSIGQTFECHFCGKSNLKTDPDNPNSKHYKACEGRKKEEISPESA